MASYFSGKSVVEGKQLIYFKKQNPTLGDASDGDGDDSDSDDAFFSGKTIVQGKQLAYSLTDEGTGGAIHTVSRPPGRPTGSTTKRRKELVATRVSSRKKSKSRGDITITTKNTAPTQKTNKVSMLNHFHTNGFGPAYFDKNCIQQHNLHPDDPDYSFESKKIILDVHTVLTMISKKDLTQWKSCFSHVSNVWNMLAHHAGVSREQMLDLHQYRLSKNKSAQGGYTIYYVKVRELLLGEFLDCNNNKVLHAGNVLGLLDKMCEEFAAHKEADFNILRENCYVKKSYDKTLSIEKQQGYFNDKIELKQISMAVLPYVYSDVDYQELDKLGHDLLNRIYSKQGLLEMLIAVMGYDWNLRHGSVTKIEVIPRNDDADCYHLRRAYIQYGSRIYRNGYDDHRDQWLKTLLDHAAKTYCDESTAVKESVLAEVKACMLSMRIVSLLKKRGSIKKKTTSTKIANEIPVTIEDKNINENSQLLLDVINGTLRSSSLLFELSFLVD